MILEWADAYFQRAGKWPNYESLRNPAFPGVSWQSVENSLRLGLRGLPGRSSLAKVLAEHRGVRNVQDLPPLTEEQVLLWADQHHKRTGKWPNEKNSGKVTDCKGETWKNVDVALRQGLRGFPGGASLAKVIARHRGVRNRSNIPHLTFEQILVWADAHFVRTGKWPKCNSGPIYGAPEEKWQNIETALYNGTRGLSGGSSLAMLLAGNRGMRNRSALPHLKKRTILSWAKLHHKRNGNWPKAYSGPIQDVPGETWRAVDMALYLGLRGLPGSMTLSQLLKGNGLGKAFRK
jgi:hypothetical protein